MIRKTKWTVPEVKEWYSEHIENERFAWDGLLYQGSDDQYHHFITRVFDEWVYIEINKIELNIDDERPYSNLSSSPLGYYFVDPSNNFIKTKEYNNTKRK